MAKDKLEAQIEEEKAVLLSVCTSNTTLERVMEYLEELAFLVVLFFKELQGFGCRYGFHQREKVFDSLWLGLVGLCRTGVRYGFHHFLLNNFRGVGEEDARVLVVRF